MWRWRWTEARRRRNGAVGTCHPDVEPGAEGHLPAAGLQHQRPRWRQTSGSGVEYPEDAPGEQM